MLGFNRNMLVKEAQELVSQSIHGTPLSFAFTASTQSTMGITMAWTTMKDSTEDGTHGTRGPLLLTWFNFNLSLHN